MSQSLYEISENYLSALEFLTNPDNEVDEETYRDTLEAVSGDMEEKAVAVAGYFLGLEAQAVAIREAERKMALRRRGIENHAARLRAYLLQNMLATGISKVECPYFAISTKKLPDSVEIVDESQIPDEFMRITREPNKTAIKSAGGCAGARIVNDKIGLNIK